MLEVYARRARRALRDGQVCAAAAEALLGQDAADARDRRRVVREITRLFGQADLVLVLLRAGSMPCRRAVETIIGHPIKRCVPFVPPRAPLPVRHSLPPDEGTRRILSVVQPCPRTGAAARERYQRMKPGMTVEQYVQKGGTRRDVRECALRGWIRLEEVVHG